MDARTLGLLYLFGLGVIALGVAVWVFRLGTRDRFITRWPFLKLGIPTISVVIVLGLREWLTGKGQDVPLHVSLLIVLAAGAATFATCAIIWLAGFAYGRWRASRSDGVISRNRRRT